jgi:hypothetical protein
MFLSSTICTLLGHSLLGCQNNKKDCIWLIEVTNLGKRVQSFSGTYFLLVFNKKGHHRLESLLASSNLLRDILEIDKMLIHQK